MARDYWNISSKTGFNRPDPHTFQIPESYDLLSSGSHRQGQNQYLCTSFTPGDATHQCKLYLICSLMLSTEVKWKQHEISNNFCNNESFGIVLFFSQHILKITHEHLLIEQYSLGKAIKGESKQTPEAQYTDYVLSPCGRTVWLNLNSQSFAGISQEFSFPLHIHY